MGIISSLVIVVFVGITKRATIASLEADLASSARTLISYGGEKSTYPVAVSMDCNTPSTHQPSSVSIDQCHQLKLSSGNEIRSYNSTGQTFLLVLENGKNIFGITDSTQPTEAEEVTSVELSGGPVAGSVLTASTVPSNATVTHQWQRADTPDGIYGDISGADKKTYNSTELDINKYIKVSAVGTGLSSGEKISGHIGPLTSPWIDGRAGSALAGKQIYYKDSGSENWGPYSTCSYQCSATGETWPGYEARRVLLASNDTNLTSPSFPARQSCKNIGGRLPTIAELMEIYNYQTIYGNNFSKVMYWSATEYYNGNVYYIQFYGGYLGNTTKTTPKSVRCAR